MAGATLPADRALAAPGGFTEVAAQSGLLYDQWDVASRDGVEGLLIHTGSAAAGDFDGDGWVDLFVTRLDATDILFRNLGGETAPGDPIVFQNVSAEAGFDLVAKTNGAAWADIDNDGDLDLYVTAVESRRFYLYENNGDGTFTENAIARGAALESGLDHAGQSVAFGDFDRDGWIDFHTTEWGIERGESSVAHSVLMRNRGAEAPGHFENVTVAAGVEMDTGDTLYGFASNFTDLDNDGWLDLAVTSDYKTAKLFWNNGDGTFYDGTQAANVNLATNAMGSAVGDFDGDGLLDWFVTSIHDNRLYLNQGDRTFVDRAESLDIADGSWGWGASFIDIENDGDKDIVMTNGWFYSTFGPEGNKIYTVDNMKLWRNDSGVMSDVGVALGVTDTREGKGLLTFDFDRDGDLDIFVVNNASRPVLYRNDIGSGNDWLQVELRATRSNSRGIGAKVWLYPAGGDDPMLEEVGGKSHFLGQSEAIAHFGLGSGASGNVKLIVEWPSGIRQIVEGVAPGQRLLVVEPTESSNEAPVFTTEPTIAGSVLRDGVFELEAEVTGNPQPVFQWYRDGEKIAGANGSRFSLDPVKPFHEGEYYVVATNLSGSVQSASVLLDVDWDISGESIARVWNEVLLDAIRKDFPNPTVHARNLYHVSAAMWDAFWAFDPRGWSEAEATFHEELVPDFGSEALRVAAQREAISYAAYRVLKERYSRSINAEDTLYAIDWALSKLGYDPNDETVEGDTAVAIGNRIGFAVIAATLDDGSNESNDYADTSGYVASNDPLVIALPGSEMLAPNHWQPLAFDYQITQNGIPLAERVQHFVGANWGWVRGFSGRFSPVLGGDWDPGAPPQVGTESQDQFLDSVNEIIRYSATLDPALDELIDISPGSRHNNPLGTYGGSGYELNPFTGQAYEANLVKHADYGRVLAEFWADGPQSETPPGHWNVLYNDYSTDPRFSRRLGGQGETVDPLEWDVMTYLALNGGMHDAAIAAWWLKREYDYVRPISMIRYLAGLGQSSDPGLPSYHEQGLKLEAGLVELVTEESSAPGERHAHLADHVGEIALYCWSGEPADAESEVGGVGWILAEKWLPYQRSTFVTPAFAAYVSGHSTFSRAGAEVLTLLTGSPYFPGGLGQYVFEKNEYLEFEDGPSERLTLQWATYYDAADEAGLSRLYGGIHVRADDLKGRVLGSRIGLDAFVRMKQLRYGALEKHDLGGLFLTARGARSRKTTLVDLAYDAAEAALPIRWGVGNDADNAVFLSAEGDEMDLRVVGRDVSSVRVPVWSEGSAEAARLDFALEGGAPRLVLVIVSRRDGAPLEGVARLELTGRGLGETGAFQPVLHETESASLVQMGRKRVASLRGTLAEERAAAVYLLGSGDYRLQVMASESPGVDLVAELMLID